MNLNTHFRELINKKRVHIEQLKIVRDQPWTLKTAKRKLDRQIAYEERQLATIQHVWDV